jgi:hypothetical protein
MDRKSETLPYAVSSARNNEMNINLAYVDLRYRSNKLRARMVPGFGTYMNANYTNETGTLQNIVEANAGVLLSEKRKIWVDVGVLGSPYTNESAVSKDHLMYTRSLAPENVPYYLSGVKVSMPINSKINAFVYILNGWQVIEDNNRGKSLGTQLEFRPGPKMLFNWNTYFGDERSSLKPNFRARYFTDLFWIYRPNQKFDATSCVYVGRQERSGSSGITWWQANFIGRVTFTPTVSLSGRIEYFNDPHQAVIAPLTSVGSFSTYSTGLCLNVKVGDNALFRVEAKQYFSNDKVFKTPNREVQTNGILAASLAAWF